MKQSEIKIPEIGMDSVFYPEISDKPEKRGEIPSSVRGRVIYVNYRTQVFTVERKVLRRELQKRPEKARVKLRINGYGSEQICV